MTLVRRRIDLTFQLGIGNFGESGFDTLKVSGLRASAIVTPAGGGGFSTCQLRVWGLTPDVMNALVTVGAPQFRTRNNVLTVEAGDEGGAMAKIFKGTILTAWFDASAMPEVCLKVTANSGGYASATLVSPTAYKRPARADIVLADICRKANFSFIPGGIMPLLAGTYFEGSAMDQILSCCTAADLDFTLDADTLYVWPRGTARGGQVGAVVSPETGLVGYPSFTQAGIAIKSIFNPGILFMGLIEVRSSLQPVNGIWQPYIMAHELEAETPGGAWFTTAECLTYAQ